MGDYNIDLLNSESHDLTNEFVDLMYCNEFLPLISRPTRITSTSATLIDNIFTNNHDDLNCSLNGILVADISDHFPIFHVNCSFTVEETDSCLVTRVYNEKNKQNFTQAISEVDWTEICNIPDTQESFDIFHSKLISLHEKCFPKIKIRKKYSNRKPWLSDALRSSIRYKNKLYHKYKNKDKNTLISLYYTFIYPYLCYCNHVWGNIYITYLDKLYLMQKKSRSNYLWCETQNSHKASIWRC